MKAPSKAKLKSILARSLDDTVEVVNRALRFEGLEKLQPVLQRLGRGQQLPHWFQGLKNDGALPNADGKTIGSIVEMLLLSVLETHTFAEMHVPPLTINPARGVDFPDLDLGVKSPSKNFCTSEPYFSAYERILGSSHDVLVLITDYQQAKRNPPLRLQIVHWKYLRSTQVADEGLCAIAKKHRDWLVAHDQARAQRFFRFLAYVNQSDWRASRLLRMIADLKDDGRILRHLVAARTDFARTNKDRMKKGNVPVPDSELESLEGIQQVQPLYVGVLDAAENWLVEARKETARAPSDAEWQSILASPLEGAIGVSLALQWRYNFGRLFGTAAPECDTKDTPIRRRRK